VDAVGRQDHDPQVHEVPNATATDLVAAVHPTYNCELCRPDPRRQGEPAVLVSHRLPVDQAPQAWEHFDAREDGRKKVVRHPNGTH
jgi:hypothetical protein